MPSPHGSQANRSMHPAALHIPLAAAACVARHCALLNPPLCSDQLSHWNPGTPWNLLAQVSLLPVLAAHQGTYHCYLSAWSSAIELYELVARPLLDAQAEGLAHHWPARRHELQAEAWGAFAAHVGSQKASSAVSSRRDSLLAASLWPGSRVVT
jgi:hypothetical protein